MCKHIVAFPPQFMSCFRLKLRTVGQCEENTVCVMSPEDQHKCSRKYLEAAEANIMVVQLISHEN